MKYLFSNIFFLCAFFSSAQTLSTSETLINSDTSYIVQVNDSLFANLTLSYNSEGQETNRQADYYTSQELNVQYNQARLALDNQLAAQESAKDATERKLKASLSGTQKIDYSNFLDSVKLSEREFVKLIIRDGNIIDKYDVSHKNNLSLIQVGSDTTTFRLRFLRNSELILRPVTLDNLISDDVILVPNNSEQEFWRARLDDGRIIVLRTRRKE